MVIYDADIISYLFMRRLLISLVFASFILSGCTSSPAPMADATTSPVPEGIAFAELAEPPTMFWPMQNFESRVTFKKFGQEVHDRFNGFHVGDDAEVRAEEMETEVTVYAAIDGRIIYRNWVAGYGGVLVMEHEVDGQTLNTLYGHIDLGLPLAALGDTVLAGTPIAYLGNDKSRETDGERKHLHFGIYGGRALKLSGYAPKRTDVSEWINPSEYLRAHGAGEPSKDITIPSDWRAHDLSTTDAAYPLSISTPSSWQAEYVSGSQAINIYDPSLPGANNLEKSVVFMRFFDAEDFQTLSTVTVLKRTLRDLNRHKAIEYVIEKKSWATPFSDQPSWRNVLHTVTDIRAENGFSRFYVVAQRPELDAKTVYYILNSIEIK